MSNITGKSPTPLKSGDIISQQSTPVSVNQESVLHDVAKQLSLFVPSNFDVDSLVKEFPPNFSYHKDCIVYMVHLVANGYANRKDFDGYFVRIHSGLVQKRIRNYRAYLDYLVNCNVLIEDRHYIPTKQSRGFVFTTKYSTEVTQTIITKRTLIKSISKFYDFKDKAINISSLEDNKLEYLTKWLNSNLKVNFTEAKSHLRDLYIKDYTTLYDTKDLKRINKQQDFHLHAYQLQVAMMKYNRRLIPLIKMHKGQFAPSIDSTAGRLHTVITQLKGDLRKFITYNGEPLVAVDIVNSQPYLSSILLNEEKFNNIKMLKRIKQHNPKYTLNPNTTNNYPIMLVKRMRSACLSSNAKTYVDLVSKGGFYEEFGNILLKQGLLYKDSSIPIRKQSKEATFSSIFSPNSLSPHICAIKSFRTVFPDVFDVFTLIKTGRNNHPTLACVLQNLEAELILHRVCKIISSDYPEIPLFTLHDSVITTPKHVDIVESIMFQVLSDAIGINPTLKREKWNDAA